MFERIDTWLGKTLFVPLIIRLCQRLRISQHSFNRICWFAAFLIAFCFAEELWKKIFYGSLALIACLLAALLPENYEEESKRWFRLVVATMTLLNVPLLDWHPIYTLVILFAEYAATIRTIPPLEEKQAERSIRAAQGTSA